MKVRARKWAVASISASVADAHGAVCLVRYSLMNPASHDGPMKIPFQNATVANRFAGYPADARRKLMELRRLIYKIAAMTPGVGTLEETLKWGEPAYLTSETGAGSTIRIDWKKARPGEYALYFNCKTSLVEQFRSMFPNDFRFEGNRALVLELNLDIPKDALAICISAALTYHRK